MPRFAGVLRAGTLVAALAGAAACAVFALAPALAQTGEESCTLVSVPANPERGELCVPDSGGDNILADARNCAGAGWDLRRTSNGRWRCDVPFRNHAGGNDENSCRLFNGERTGCRNQFGTASNGGADIPRRRPNHDSDPDNPTRFAAQCPPDREPDPEWDGTGTQQCVALQRSVAVSRADNGTVVATVAGAVVGENRSAESPATEPVTFAATPDDGYYVSEWTGDCENNPSATTGEGDSGANIGAAKTCVVDAGTEDVVAGAMFATVENCPSRHRPQATATTCGALDSASLASAPRITAADIDRFCADAGGRADNLLAYNPTFIRNMIVVGRQCIFGTGDPRNCHALNAGTTVPANHQLAAANSNGHCDDIHPACSGGEPRTIENNPLSGCGCATGTSLITAHTSFSQTEQRCAPSDSLGTECALSGWLYLDSSGTESCIFSSGDNSALEDGQSGVKRANCSIAGGGPSVPRCADIFGGDIPDADGTAQTFFYNCPAGSEVASDRSACTWAVSLDPGANGSLSAKWFGDSDLEDGERVPAGTRVTFVARPDVRYYVSGWTGCAEAADNIGSADDVGSQECAVVVSEQLTVGAVFKSALVDQCRVGGMVANFAHDACVSECPVGQGDEDGQCAPCIGGAYSPAAGGSCIACSPGGVAGGEVNGGFSSCECGALYVKGDGGVCVQVERTVALSARASGGLAGPGGTVTAESGGEAIVDGGVASVSGSVTITAVPDDGWYVQQWDGNCRTYALIGTDRPAGTPIVCVVPPGTSAIDTGAAFDLGASCGSSFNRESLNNPISCGGCLATYEDSDPDSVGVSACVCPIGTSEGNWYSDVEDFLAKESERRCVEDTTSRPQRDPSVVGITAFTQGDMTVTRYVPPASLEADCHDSGWAVLDFGANWYCLFALDGSMLKDAQTGATATHCVLRGGGSRGIPDCAEIFGGGVPDQGSEARMILHNCPSAVSADHSACYYKVVIPERTHGAVSASWAGDSDLESGEGVAPGATVTFTAVPNPGYYVTTWIGCPPTAENTGGHDDGGSQECAAVVDAELTVRAVFVDIDECQTDNACDENASCENHAFSGIAPICTCNEGYDGNGVKCYALRTVGISAATNGTVSASSTSDLNIRDGETARQESTVFFTATPTVGFYVSGWTGDCDNNAAATTGEDDPPGTPQSCEVAPGVPDIAAGATFSAIADCASRKRVNDSATSCGSCMNGFATADVNDADDAAVLCLPVASCGVGQAAIDNGTACECDAANGYRDRTPDDGVLSCELVVCDFVNAGEVRVGTECHCRDLHTRTSGNPNSSGTCVTNGRVDVANACEAAGWRLNSFRTNCVIAINNGGTPFESCSLLPGGCANFFADSDGDGVPNLPRYDAALDVPTPRRFAMHCADGREPSGKNDGGQTECVTFPTVYVDPVSGGGAGGALSVSWAGVAGWPSFAGDDDLQSGDKVPPGTTVTFAATPADDGRYVAWWTGDCESSGAATGADDSGGGEVKTCEIVAERATDVTVGVIFEEIVACEPLHRAERSDAVSCGGCLPTFADSDGGRFVTCECPAGTVEVSAFLSDGDFLANTPDRRCVASDSLAAECALSGWDYLDYGGAKICSFGRDGSTLEDAQSGGVRTRCLVGGEVAGDASVGCGDVFGEDIPDKASSAREFFFNCPGDAGFDSARGTCTWTVNLNPGANGSLSASWAGDDDLRNGGTVLHNALVTFTAAPDDNYYVIGWTGCAQTTDNLGRPTDGGDKDCAAVVDFNLTVSASFEARNANRCPDGFYDPDGVAPDGTGVNCVRKRFTLADLNQYCLASGLSSPFATLGTGVGAGAIGSFCFLLADQDRNCFVLNDGVVVETGTVLGDTTPGSQVRSFGAYPAGLCDVVYPDCGESGQVAVEADNPLFGCMDPPSGSRPVNFSRLLFGGSMSAAVGGVAIDSGDLAEEGAEVTFTATPSGAGFYVSEWTGDCENNPTAATGVGDAAGGAAKVCVVVADGRSEVAAGAVFAAAEVCGDVFRGDGDRPDACGECLRGYADAGGAADVGACVAGDVGSAADLCADAGWAVAAGRQFCVVAARVAGEASGASQCYFAQANPAEGNAELDAALRTSSVACGDVFGSPPVFPLLAGGVGVSGNPVLYCAGAGELVSADGTRCVAACPGSQASDGGVNARCVCASGVVTLDGMDCAGECPAGETATDGQCVCNADREVREGACVCSEAEAIDVGEGVCAQSRAVSVLGSDNGVVVATVLGAEVAEAGSARSPVTVPVTFVAAPDGGYYVESWTGDCLSNPSAGTGEGDATGGVSKSCIVDAGSADISAGAVFGAVRDCGDENREGADGVLVCGVCSVNYEDFNNDGDCTACDSRIAGSVSEVGGSCGCVPGAITDESLSFLNSAGNACVNRSGCLAGEGPDETGRTCAACVGNEFNPTAGESCMVCENGGTVGGLTNGGWTTCECAGDYTGTACDTLPDCPDNSSRTTDADKCVCDVNYSPASGSPSSGVDVVCALDMRSVSVSVSDGGVVVATVSGLEVSESQATPSPVTEPVTFVATPDGDYYVESWTGDCLSNPSAGTGEGDATGGGSKSCVVSAGSSDIEAGAVFGAVRDCGSENREGADGVLVCGVCSVNHEDFNNDGSCTACDSRIVGSVSEVGGSCGCDAGTVTDESLSFLNSAGNACVNRSGCLAGEGPDETGRTCAACVGDEFNPTAGESCMVCMNGGTVGDAVNGGWTTCTCAGDYTGAACDTLPDCPSNSSRASDGDKCVCDVNYSPASGSPSSGTDVVCESDERSVSVLVSGNGVVVATVSGSEVGENDSADSPVTVPVTFVATPDSDYYVLGWTGDCDNNSSAGTGEGDATGGIPKSCVVSAGNADIEAGATFAAVRDCGDENREGADGVLVCGVCSVNYEDFNNDGSCTACDSRIAGSVSEVGGSCGCVAGAITDGSLSFLNSAGDACVSRAGCLVGEGADETGRVCSACVGDEFNPTAGESCMVCMNGGTVGDVVNGGFTTCTCSGDWTGTACDVLPACPDNASRGSDADKCVCDDEYRVADSSPALSGVDVVCEVLLRTVFAAFSQNGTVVATVAGVEISEGGSALSPVTERVTFTASPGSDYYVKSWTGDCAAERSPVVATTGEGDAPGAVQVCVVAAGGDYTWAGAVFAGVADCAGLNQERTDATTCGSCVGVYVDTNPNDDRFTCGCPVGWEEAGDGCQPCSAGKFNGSAGGSCGVCDGVVRDGDGNKVDAGATRCDVCLNGGTRADVNTNACACVGDYYGDLCGSRDSCPDNSSRDLSEGVAAQCVCDDDYSSPDGAPDRGTSVICVLNERAVSVLVSDNGVVAATVSGMEVSESETTLSPVTVPVTFVAVPDDGYYVTVWTGDCESNSSATTGEDDSPGAVQACVVSAGDADIRAGAVFAEVADCDGENRIRTSATECGGCDTARHYFDKDGSEDVYECVLPTRANCKSVNKVANNVDDALSTGCVVVSEANCATVGEYADPIGHTRTCLESCPNSYGTSPTVPGACSFCEGGRESPDGRTPCACPAGERPTVKSGVCVTGAAMDAAEACEAAGWRLNDDGDRCLVKSVNGDTGVAQSSCDLASGCAVAFGSGFNFPTTIAADAETPREFVYNCGTDRNPAGANTRGETECCDDPTTDDGAGVCRPTAETCGAYGGAAVNDAYDPADRHAHPPCVCGEGDGGTPGTEEGEGCFAAWTIYLSAATNGTLSATAAGDAVRDGDKVSRGATVTFAASPSPGYYVSAWDGCEGISPESVLGGDDDGDAKLCAAAALSDLRVSVSFAEREQCPGLLVNSAGDGCVDFCAAGEELNEAGDACVVCDSGEYNPTPDGRCVVCGDNGTRMSATVCECDSGYAKGASGECVVAVPRAEMVGVVAASLVAAPEGNYFVREWVGVTCANDGDATGDADNPGAVKVCELSSATSAAATVGVVYLYSRTATLGTVPADGTGGTVYATVAAAVPEELSDGDRVSSREFVFVVAVPAAGWRVASWGEVGGVCKDAPTSQDENDTGAKVCVIRPGDDDLNVGVIFESVSSSDPGL